jgi:TP901 family phage tail tape measure protein
MAAEVTAKLGLHINTTGLDQLARVEKALAGITKAANTNVAASQRSTAAAVKAGQTQEQWAIRVQRTSASMAQKQADAAEKASIRMQLTSARWAAQEQSRQEKAALAAERRAERERKSIRTVETEMERLTKLEERRKLTAEANVRLNRPSGFFAGHGFIDKTRGFIGGVRDLTVAGMGAYYAARGAMHLAHAVIDPVREYQFELTKLRSKQNFSVSAMADINKSIRSNRDSIFTPLQAAEAGTTLAAAGVGAHGHHEDLIAALNPTLKFSQASELSTEESAHMLIGVGNQFGFKSKDFAHVADVLTAAKENSTASFNDLADSLTYVGPVANAAGQSLEKTASMLALLAEGNIKSSVAGTGLRSVLTSLVQPTKQTKDAMHTLGLDTRYLHDAVVKGDMPALFRKLGQAMDMKHLDKADRLKVMKQMFGENGMVVAIELSNAALRNQGQLWEQIDHNVEGAKGQVDRMSAQLGDTLEGRIRKLDARWESFKLNLGEKMLPVLDKALPKAAGFVDSLSSHLEGTSGTGLLGEVVGVAVGVGLAKALVTGLTSYMAGAGATAWASAWASAGGTAGVPFSAALGAAVIAGIAGWQIGSALARALKIDLASQEGTVKQLDNNGNVTFQGSAADAARHAAIKSNADKRAAAFEDVAGLNEKPISAFSGELHIKIDHDGKPKVHRLTTQGAPLNVGVSVTR